MTTSSRIRFEGQNLSKGDRKVLYHGWIGGRLLSNAGAYLPLITETQLRDIQTACNSAVRAVARLPKKGYYPISKVRQSLGIDSVEDVTRSHLLFAGWSTKPVPTETRSTRGTMNRNIRLPSKSGWTGKKILTKRLEAWNELPLEIKREEKGSKAKKMIKHFVRQEQ